MRIFVATFCNSVESLSINEDYVDDYIHVATFVGHRLYRLAHLVSIAMCMVVEIIGVLSLLSIKRNLLSDLQIHITTR
jgi:hypothetical protein